MESLLLGKKALITGGTRGIGKAIALCFAKAGASVVILGTNSQKGEEALSEIRSVLSKGQNAAFFALDISDKEAVQITLEKIIEEWKGIDILVNNAGITRDNLLMRMKDEDWDDVININLKAVFNMCRFLVRPMLKAKQGKIINISSVVGIIGNPGQANYVASKAGVIGLTKTLAKELASRNICVNCIAPGFIQTDMTDVLTEDQKNSILYQIPMQRLGTPEDIANMALFLASPLSDYITGQVVPVDGGMVMQ